MKLKKLFIFRHGVADFHGFLTEIGRAQIERLGKFLRNQYGLKEHETEIICSDKLRALKTAQCLTITIGLDDRTECYKELYSDDRDFEVQPAIDVLKRHAEMAEILIVITHKEMATVLPPEFGRQVLGLQGMQFLDFQYGQGCVINCEKRTWELVGY